MTDVIFRIIPGAGGDVGKIILNRPQSLNALNLQMCAAIYLQLIEWGAKIHQSGHYYRRR